MSDHIKTYSVAKKCIHPKVLRVLEKYAPVSPILVPKDQHQPREGKLCIYHSKCLESHLIPKQEVIIKAPMALSLESSLLKRRRVCQKSN